MASLATAYSSNIPFDENHPSFSYDSYVEAEAARYDAALRFRTDNLAKRDSTVSIHVPVMVDAIVYTYRNKAERMEAAHRQAMAPWPSFDKVPASTPAPGHGNRMREWAELRKGPTNSAKFFADQLNDVHKEYLAGEIDLDRFVDEVYSYLEPKASSDDVFAFLLSKRAMIEKKANSPGDARTKFASWLNNAWKAHCENQGISAPSIEDEEQEGAIAGDSAPIVSPSTAIKEDYRQLKKAQNKSTVIASHSGLVAGTAIFADFLKTNRKFILMKVQNGLKEYTKHGMTEEDVTQIALIRMADALPRFKGTSEDYFYWLQKLIYNAVLDARKGSVKEDSRLAPLFVVNEDGEEDEHPGIGGKIAIKRNGKVEYQDAPQEFVRKLPDWIQGDNLMICKLIREGKSFAEIGEALGGMTEAAVTLRVSKMRNRNLEEKEAAK